MGARSIYFYTFVWFFTRFFLQNPPFFFQQRQFFIRERMYTDLINYFFGESMNYVKKMCILRQVKQGFSGDGKALSGLIKIEQYGKNLAVEVSIINFAPLVSGEYYCLLSDGKGKTEMLCLRGKSLFNILSDLDVSGGFCGVICYVKNEVIPIAYGINGNGSYDWRSILNATLPPVFPRPFLENDIQNPPAQSALSPSTANTFSPPKTDYDDDTLANDNYYEREENDESIQPEKTDENAYAEGATEIQDEKKGTATAKNGNVDCVREGFAKNPDGYYLSVKAELDELFRCYPKDKTLSNAFSSSEWVRIKGSAKQPQYLVGALYEDGKAQYICYALAAEDKDNPPEEIKNVCAFVPCSFLKEKEGFFVIFQSATTGECIKPESV